MEVLDSQGVSLLQIEATRLHDKTTFKTSKRDVSVSIQCIEFNYAKVNLFNIKNCVVQHICVYSCTLL